MFSATKPNRISIAMIRRFAVLGCRNNINFTYRRVTSTLHHLQGRIMTRTVIPAYDARVIHTRLLHYTSSFCKNKSRDDVVTEDMPTLQIKRPPRRNRVIINDDKTPKSNVSLSRRGIVVSFLSRTLVRWMEI